MILQKTFEHKYWSNRVRWRGIRRVAKEAKVDYAWLSRAVNNKVVVTQKQLRKLVNATNKLKVNYGKTK